MGNNIKEPFLKYLEITSREAYDFYRENRKAPSKTIDQYNYYVKAIRGMIDLLEDMMTEAEGGVYIDGLGYFCNVYKMEAFYDGNKFGKKYSLRNRYFEKTAYNGYFKPYKTFEGWVMDGTFSKSHRLKIRASEIKYKLNFDLCEAYSVNQHAQRVEGKNRQYIRKL